MVGEMRRGKDVLEQAVAALGGRQKILCDEDGDDERVNGDNSGHDDRNEALQRAWSQ